MKRIKNFTLFIAFFCCLSMLKLAYAETQTAAETQSMLKVTEVPELKKSSDALSFLGYEAVFIPPQTSLSPFFDFQQKKWQQMQEKYSPKLYDLDTIAMTPQQAHKWKYLLNHLKKVPKIETLKGINDFMNKVPSGADQDIYKQEEYWAMPDEFFKNWLGDCEDYVFAKYFALQYLEWPLDSLWVLLIYQREHKNFHAVLAVDFEDKVYILDNLAKPTHKLIAEEEYKNQALPLSVLSHNGYWIFHEGVIEYVEKYMEKKAQQ